MKNPHVFFRQQRRTLVFFWKKIEFWKFYATLALSCNTAPAAPKLHFIRTSSYSFCFGLQDLHCLTCSMFLSRNPSGAYCHLGQRCDAETQAICCFGCSAFDDAAGVNIKSCGFPTFFATGIYCTTASTSPTSNVWPDATVCSNGQSAVVRQLGLSLFSHLFLEAIFMLWCKN